MRGLRVECDAIPKEPNQAVKAEAGKYHESDEMLFQPCSADKAGVWRTSRRNDDWSFEQDMALDAARKSYMNSRFPGVRVNTLYKRKADKVQPVNSSESDGSKPGGDPKWREKAIARERAAGLYSQPRSYSQWLNPRFASFVRGSRLKPERVERLLVGDMLSPAEKDVMLEMLYNREGALAWEFDEIGRVKDEVAPPQEIKTIPHEAWQAKSFHIPKALEPKVIEIVTDRKRKGVLEDYYSPY